VRLFGAKRARISVVASVISRYDAISSAACDTVRAFRRAGDFAVDVFAARCDFPELRAHIVSKAAALASHRAYRAADAIIYHFGVFSPLFETVTRASDGQRHVLRFHGITPPECVAPSQRLLLEQSLDQLKSFGEVDRFWATSPTTAEALVAQGVGKERIEIIPLAVEGPARASLALKPTPPIRLLFVGRMTQAKGVLDLIEALDLVRGRTAIPIELDLAGNEEYSDAAYVRAVRAAVTDRGLSGIARIHGAVDDAQLDALYRVAHIVVVPSYHEGFCRPIVEGFRAGCVPMGYATYNLPVISRGLGRMVPVGDRGALATALADLANALASTEGVPAGRRLPLDGGALTPEDFDAAAQIYVRDFTFERIAALEIEGTRRLLSP
jgi:glycosyltransferase involved in cell wall biosynthesis